MLGSVASSNDLGAIPCAISWLYKGINEKRQKSGARFSVRVSALGINATKPGSSAKDLLAALATGNYLNVRLLSASTSPSFPLYYPNELISHPSPREGFALCFSPRGGLELEKEERKVKRASHKNRIK